MNYYDHPDAYDLFFTQHQHDVIRGFYNDIFKDRKINSILDCSVGSGNLTFPIADLGYTVSGSDISAPMIDAAKEKARKSGYDIDLRVADFRRLTEVFTDPFDCVISTGNSLPHVPKKDAGLAIEQMSALVKPGGYIYIDLRNWDLITKNKQRFYFLNPVFKDDIRINYTQVWDHNSDGSITFNILINREKDNRIIEKDHYTETYYPLLKDTLVSYLEETGFKDIKVMNHVFPQITDFEKMQWYCVMGQKS